MKLVATKIKFLLFLILCVGSYSAKTVSAEEQLEPSAEASSIVEALLESYWGKNKENRAASVLAFENSAESRRSLLAFTLNQMHHNRTREALKVAETMTKRFPDDVDGWVLRMWLDVVVKDYDRALIDLRLLKKAMVKNAADLDERTQNMIMRRVGRMIGFLEGPKADRVNEEILVDAIDRVLTGLTPKQLNLLDTEREKVLAKFQVYSVKRVEQVKSDRVKAEEINKNEKEALKKDNQRLDKEAEQIAPRIQKVTDEGARQVAVLRDQLSPLQRGAATVNSQLDSVGYDLQLTYADLNNVQHQLSHDPHNFYLRRHYNSLSNYARNREFDLGNLRGRINGIVGQMNTLNAQISRTNHDYNQRVRSIEQERKSIVRTRRRNWNKLKKLAKDPLVTSGKLTALQNRGQSLSSYDPFPVELFREYLLEKLVK